MHVYLCHSNFDVRIWQGIQGWATVSAGVHQVDQVPTRLHFSSNGGST
jgi:hypothetical protein